MTGRQEGEPSTRTVLADDLSTVLWSPSDEIKVFCKEWEEPGRLISTNTEATANAKFEGDVTPVEGSDGDAEYWGLYPYKDDAKWVDGVFTTCMESGQKALANSFNSDIFISIGHSDDINDMSFYNVCSGLKLKIDRDDITNITLTALGGEPLTGTFSVDFNDDGVPQIIQYPEPTDENSSVTLKSETNLSTNAWYYIVLLPQTLNDGFSLTFEGPDENGELVTRCKMTSHASITFSRSKFVKTDLKLSPAIISTDIEQPKVRSYLEEVDYSNDLDNYATSYISQYASGSSSSGGGSSGGGPGGGGGGGSSSSSSTYEDRPLPVTFTWASTGARTLYVDTDSEFTNSQMFEVSASDATTEIYNLIPNVTYYCKTISASGKVEWESSFVPEGPLRMIYIDGVRNVRDLGGWKAGNNTVRYGRLYRGAQFNNITQDGRNCVLNDMGVTVDIDLRGGNENTLNLADYYSYGVTLFSITGDSGSRYANAIQNIIKLLNEDKVVYFHCMVGADRTGTLAFLIEALLGVSESDLSKDFELTSFYQTRTRNGSDQFSLYRMIPTIKNYSGDTMQEKVTEWAIQNGITAEEIQLLKELMLE